ncbi:MAG: phosphatidylserine/phosphatidylglycerophosphate/cardiolipin synthase family protein [Polyangiaceae bacterium]|nr:phosphatidylserine/phosphatidylglycerophosphate/cardiolipin synthase family protein [Polyangiaceae bacterium]
MHSKSLIIDGCRAILTGANIQNFYDERRSWFDGSFEVGGDAAALLRVEFQSAWRVKNSGAQFQQLRPVAPPQGHQQNVSVVLFGRPSGSLLFALTSAGMSDNSQALGFLALLNNAQQVIRIHTPNFNVSDILKALKRAIERGVRVEIVLSKNFNEGTERWVGGTNTWAAAQLLDWAAERQERLNLLFIRWYAHIDSPGTAVDDSLDAERKFSSHAKYMSIDNVVVVVGSTNMDNQSFFNSREANLAVFCAPVCRAWDAAFFMPSFGRAEPVRPEPPRELAIVPYQPPQAPVVVQFHGAGLLGPLFGIAFNNPMQNHLNLSLSLVFRNSNRNSGKK